MTQSLLLGTVACISGIIILYTTVGRSVWLTIAGALYAIFGAVIFLVTWL